MLLRHIGLAFIYGVLIVGVGSLGLVVVLNVAALLTGQTHATWPDSVAMWAGPAIGWPTAGWLSYRQYRRENVRPSSAVRVSDLAKRHFMTSSETIAQLRQIKSRSWQPSSRVPDRVVRRFALDVAKGADQQLTGPAATSPPPPTSRDSKARGKGHTHSTGSADVPTRPLTQAPGSGDQPTTRAVTVPTPLDSPSTTPAPPPKRPTRRDEPQTPASTAQAVPLRATLPFGGQVGDYRLQHRIGSGNMGSVYRAVDAAGKPAAIKLMAPSLLDAPEFRTRFARESRALKALPPSPLLPAYLGAGTHEQTPYLVMGYIDSPSLREVGTLETADVAVLALQLAQALALLHTSRLSHRDVKPANVLWSPRRGVCLVDFGIAHVEDETHLTATGSAIGSPGFMAPEVAGGGHGTSSADVWAWAAVCCWAVSGQGLFGTGSHRAIIVRAATQPPDADVIATTRALGDSTHQLIRAALRTEPAQRPSAAELVAALAPGARPA